MTNFLTALAFVVVVWSIFAGGLQRWRITAPIVLVLAGVVVGFAVWGSLASTLNTEVAQRVAEFSLAMLLFLHATDVRGGFFGRDPQCTARLLFIALPLSLALSVMVGRWLLPNLSWGVLVVIACAVAPIDFASAPGIVRDDRIPERVRNLLTVEAGYSDGIVSPVFVCALAVAVGEPHRRTFSQILTMAVPPVIKAMVVGILVGGSLALLCNTAEARDLMTEQSKRLVLIVAPILSYGLSLGIDGNGFISSFVCGITLAGLRRTESLESQLAAADDIGFLLGALMWFVFGCVTVMLLENGIQWGIVVFALLVLTFVRLLPVLLSTMGSRLSWQDRIVVGCLAPRGAPTIVFGLLAFNALDGEAADSTLLAVVLVVLGSIVFHGAGGPATARLYERAPQRSKDVLA